MKTVTLANAQGKTKKVNVVGSIGYLFLGPIYYFIKKMIIRGILLLLVYAGVILVVVDANNPSFNLPIPEQVLALQWWLLGILIGLHLLLVFLTPRAEVKKLYKKGYVPYAEIDTQLLIKHNMAKVGTLCYLSSFNAKDGVQGKIKMGNSKDLDKELKELQQLLKEGVLTKDEYETKRAMAIMRADKK